jgi:hypothetical protein
MEFDMIMLMPAMVLLRATPAQLAVDAAIDDRLVEAAVLGTP